MCCCKKGIKHDQNIKYQIKINESQYKYFEKELKKQESNSVQ